GARRGRGRGGRSLPRRHRRSPVRRRPAPRRVDQPAAATAGRGRRLSPSRCRPRPPRRHAGRPARLHFAFLRKSIVYAESSTPLADAPRDIELSPVEPVTATSAPLLPPRLAAFAGVKATVKVVAG